MIIVDTSVWIAAHRAPDGRDAVVLRSLLDSGDVALALPVRIEYLAGAKDKDRRALARALSALPLVVPTRDTWRLVEDFAARGRDAGRTFGIADLLIAALAHDLAGLLWSLDKHFDEMEALGFVRRY